MSANQSILYYFEETMKTKKYLDCKLVIIQQFDDGICATDILDGQTGVPEMRQV